MTAMTIMIIGDSTHSGSRHDAVLTLVRKGHYVYPTTHDSTGCKPRTCRLHAGARERNYRSVLHSYYLNAVFPTPNQ